MAPAIPYLLAATVAMGAFSANAQYQAGRSQQKAYEYQAEVSKREGELSQAAANMEAASIERQGAQEEDIARQRLRVLLGRQRSLYAKAGVDLSTGSPLTVLAATAAEGEQDALTIRASAEEQAAITRYQGRIGQYRSGLEAEGSRFSGRSARLTGKTQATTTVLSTLGTVAAMGSGGGKTKTTSTSNSGQWT